MQAVADPSVDQYRAAIALAVRAPSLHNTQPWRWAITGVGLELRADRDRQLTITDMDGHSLMLGCGAALHLARLGLRAQGWDCEVQRLPDPADPDLLARIRPARRVDVGEEDRRSVDAAVHRHSERRPFDRRPVPDAVLQDLCHAAQRDGEYLHVVQRREERLDLVVAASWADRYEQADPELRAELGRWVRAEDGARDGVPAAAVPHVTGGPRHTAVPMRDFERSGVDGAQLVTDLVDEQPVLAVLFTTGDDDTARLRAGEALARVLVRAQELGLAASVISQPVDFPGVRARVRALMSWVDHPQILLRLGWPPAGPPAPRTGRRAVDEVTTQPG